MKVNSDFFGASTTPAVSYADSAPVAEYVQPALAVSNVALSQVIQYTAPALDVEYINPAPAVSCVAPAFVVEYIASALDAEPWWSYAVPVSILSAVPRATTLFDDASQCGYKSINVWSGRSCVARVGRFRPRIPVEMLCSLPTATCHL